MNSQNLLLTDKNYLTHYKKFNDRQAGISEVYCPKTNSYIYNAYCIEKKSLVELVSAEFDFLDDALRMINDEFHSWELQEFAPQKSGCGSCAAKKN